jgi:hypothetical protein
MKKQLDKLLLITQVASHDISSEERFFPGFPRRFFAYFTRCGSKSQAMKQWKNRNDRSLRHKNEEIASGSHYKKMNGARADIWNHFCPSK